MLNGLGEEQPAGVARPWLVELPQEEILVEEVEHEERETREAVDNGRDDAVGDCDDHEEGRARKERAPGDAAQGVLDAVDAARGAAEDEEFDIVEHEGDSLEEAGGGTGEALKDDICEEEVGGLG